MYNYHHLSVSPAALLIYSEFTDSFPAAPLNNIYSNLYPGHVSPVSAGKEYLPTNRFLDFFF